MSFSPTTESFFPSSTDTERCLKLLLLSDDFCLCKEPFARSELSESRDLWRIIERSGVLLSVTELFRSATENKQMINIHMYNRYQRIILASNCNFPRKCFIWKLHRPILASIVSSCNTNHYSVKKTKKCVYMQNYGHIKISHYWIV